MAEGSFDESTCGRCDRANHVWYTPVEVWHAVYGPGGQPTRQGVLCPSCFIDDAEQAGVTAPQGTSGWTVQPGLRPDPRIVEQVTRLTGEAVTARRHVAVLSAAAEELLVASGQTDRDVLVAGRARMRAALELVGGVDGLTVFNQSEEG